MNEEQMRTAESNVQRARNGGNSQKQKDTSGERKRSNVTREHPPTDEKRSRGRPRRRGGSIESGEDLELLPETRGRLAKDRKARRWAYKAWNEPRK